MATNRPAMATDGLAVATAMATAMASRGRKKKKKKKNWTKNGSYQNKKQRFRLPRFPVWGSSGELFPPKLQCTAVKPAKKTAKHALINIGQKPESPTNSGNGALPCGSLVRSFTSAGASETPHAAVGSHHRLHPRKTAASLILFIVLLSLSSTFRSNCAAAPSSNRCQVAAPRASELLLIKLYLFLPTPKLSSPPRASCFAPFSAGAVVCSPFDVPPASSVLAAGPLF